MDFTNEKHNHKKKNLSGFNSIREVWESNSSPTNNKLLDEGKKYITSLPGLIGTGPSTIVLLDLSTSEFKSHCGEFKKVFGISFSENLKLMDIAISTHPLHNSFISKNFPSYLNTIIGLNLRERNNIELTTVFMLERDNKYFWINQRVFKYFSRNAESLGLVVMECTDISEVKRDSLAKFIVYKKGQGILVNETQNSESILIEQLTVSELEISRLISSGLSDKDLAAHLTIAVNTVKQHKKNIFSKLGISKSIELVAITYESGILTKNSKS